MLGVGAKKKTYVDDVFSTFLYTGSSGGKTINNGIDLLSNGGLVWAKRRDGEHEHGLYDTVRGVEKRLSSDNNSAEETASTGLKTFTSTGFTCGSADDIGGNGDSYSSWTFRKAPGFFDIVKYTGNGQANRVVTHNLGAVPGCIMIKKLSGSQVEDWRVYHRGTDSANPGDYYLRLNHTHARNDTPTFMDTIPTSTQFLLNSYSDVNSTGETYIAYLFAGDSPDSVRFDGTGDWITTGQGNMWTFGTGDFTVECWVKFDKSDTEEGVYQNGGTSTGFATMNYGSTPSVGHNQSNWVVFGGSSGNNQEFGGGTRNANQWYHIAHVRNSGTTKLYVDGVEAISFSDSTNYQGNRAVIGGYYSSSYTLEGNITNFRVVKGTAVYTSAFTPPTSPLTNISGTVLLCCNTGSPTGHTVDDSGNGNTSNGDPQQSADVPSSFLDTNLFGENEDQNVIRCGSYIGGGSTYNEIDLGWEPQWILLKNADDASSNWILFDSMRGITDEAGDDKMLYANTLSTEAGVGANALTLTSTGFKPVNSSSNYNGSNERMTYIAIRRPDGYVGKPAEVGTDVFAMDTGNSSSTIPSLDSGFPVDVGLIKNTGSSSNWFISSRLTGDKYLKTNVDDSETSGSNVAYDSNTGFSKNQTSNEQGWMWKRHAGFDVVTYTGNGTTSKRDIRHQLSKTPEMIWTKNRGSGSNGWVVWHKGLTVTPLANAWIPLSASTAQDTANTIYGSVYQTLPTSTHWTVRDDNRVNGNGHTYIAMLFASVDGICKIGSYTGDGTTNGTKSITTGFQPRFVLLRAATTGSNWQVADTLLGINAGNDGCIILNKNETNNQDGTNDWIDVTSTGFTVSANNATAYPNINGETYIYYAHA